MRDYIFLFLLTINILGNARNISGVVLSESDSVPMADARCVLTVAGENTATADTDNKGCFVISSPKKGNMLLTIEKEGFNPMDVVIESAQPTIDLGVVWLSQATMLDEVTVDGDVSFDTKGRTIVFPSKADVKASENSLSLFRKLPLDGLDADPINRRLTVLGDSPTILINNVPSSLNDLLAIHPKDIEKVEYSVLPPARYAAKGTKGYISITLRRRNDGGNVNLWARSALTTTFADAQLTGAYHQGPSQFSALFTPSWRNYRDVYDHVEESYIGSDGFRLDFASSDRNPFNYFSAPAQLKYVFAPDMATILSAALNFSSLSSHRRAYGTTLDFLKNDFDFDNESRSKTINSSLDLYFRRDFNPKNTLEIQMVGTLSNDKYRRDNVYTYHSGDVENYLVDVHSNRRSLITDASYSHHFSERTELSAGLTNTLSHSENRYITTDYNPTLTENNNNAYISLGQLVDRVYLNLRTGMQFNRMRNDDNRRHYIRNFSAVQLQWTPRRWFTLSARANYNSGIPGLTSITDYAQQITPYLISNGNPNLKTAHYIYAALNPSFRYRKLTVNASVSFSKSFNSTYSDVSYIGDGMFLSQTVNSDFDNTWAAVLQVQMSNLKGFGFNVRLKYMHAATCGAGWRESLASWSGVVNLWYNYRKFIFSYYRKFPGKDLFAQTVTTEENGDALQVTFQPDEHWSIQASWMYMFEKHGTKYPTWRRSAVNPSYTNRYIRDNSNMVCISVSYTADFGSIFRSARRTLNNSDNSSSILKL